MIETQYLNTLRIIYGKLKDSSFTWNLSTSPKQRAAAQLKEQQQRKAKDTIMKYHAYTLDYLEGLGIPAVDEISKGVRVLSAMTARK